LVFVTTHRRGVPDDATLRRCPQVIREGCADLGAEPAELNGEHATRIGMRLTPP